MHPVSFRPAPGCVIEWTVGPRTADAAAATPGNGLPLSYNQQLHLASAQVAAVAGLPGNPWIGATFEIEGSGDLGALERSFTTWVRRHESLRSGFRPTAEGIERFTVEAEDISLERTAGRDFGSAQALHAHLEERFAVGTDPFAWPPLVLGVISRRDRSTAFVAMDHVCGDGYSLALAVWELESLYEAEVQHRDPALPEPGSHLEHCTEERERGQSMGADHPVIGQWREFIRASGGTTPTFPLHLGVEPGQTWPQRLDESVLLPAGPAADFEEACRKAGGSFFAGVLAAMGMAVHEITGREEFRTIVPVHTRYKRRWRPAMGWFITCAPVEFSLADAVGFTDVLPRAEATARAALRLSRYPAVRIVELLGDDFRVTRRDLFSMVSYTDYRTLPGAERYAEWNPRTIGQVSVADDTHVWLSRTHDGLHIAIRHPDTPIAGEVLAEYLATIGAVLNRVAVTGDYPMAPAWACRPLPGALLTTGQSQGGSGASW
jgi:hypothetical protein